MYSREPFPTHMTDLCTLESANDICLYVSTSTLDHSKIKNRIHTTHTYTQNIMKLFKK